MSVKFEIVSCYIQQKASIILAYIKQRINWVLETLALIYTISHLLLNVLVIFG